jgi:vacuolar protein sorting-associated protein VTA1
VFATPALERKALAHSLCAGTYYAAQIGISSTSKDDVGRKFLGELLGALETMRSDVSASDAATKEVLESEAASAAYFEGFALRVFTVADEEDRAGKATRCVTIFYFYYQHQFTPCWN